MQNSIFSVMEAFSAKKLTDDSRAVQAGDVFVCCRKVCASDERAVGFIRAALAAGAAAVVTDVSADVLAAAGFSDAEAARVVQVPSAGLVLSVWGKLQHAQQPEVLVGVTGTNGKTSVTWFYRQLAALAGKHAAGVGTLGVWRGEPSSGGGCVDVFDGETGYTSPSALKIHEILAKLHGQGVTHACTEVSSHALDQHRLDGCVFAAAAFTNLTPDHRDYHGSMEAYQTAKMRLFAELLPANGTAVVPLGHDHTAAVREVCRVRGLQVLTVSTGALPEMEPANIVVQPLGSAEGGTRVLVRFGGLERELVLPLIGAFQFENVGMALGLALASDLDAAALMDGLPFVSGVPGRMEVVRALGSPAGELGAGKAMPTVIVDYAHTSDGLENALLALQDRRKACGGAGRLWVVFGCGGNRDATKRPQMGEIAARLADFVVVTDDNPRFEEGHAIRLQVLAGVKAAGAEMDLNAFEVADRKGAIERAIFTAAPQDTVLIAGKGHEQGQLVKGEVLPFDDRVVAREILSLLN